MAGKDVGTSSSAKSLEDVLLHMKAGKILLIMICCRELLGDFKPFYPSQSDVWWYLSFGEGVVESGPFHQHY